MKRSRIIWVCDLCGVEHETPARPNSKHSLPNGWVSVHTPQATDRKRYQIDTHTLAFCSAEHKTAFMELSTRAKKAADVAAEEVMQRVFVEEMKKGKDELRSAVDRLADLGREDE